MEVEHIESAVAMIRAGVDMLLKADLTVLSSVQVTQFMVELETERRRFEPVDQRVLAEVVTRGIAGDYARTSPADLLVDLLRVRPGEARARVGRAAELGPRRELSGLVLDPILPETAAAVADGAISSDHADVIVKAVRAVPDEFEAQFGQLVEHALVEQARHSHPGIVARAAEELLDRIDPDGRAPKDEELHRRREFGLRQHADGSSTPYGRFTPQATAAWTTILDSLAAPQPAEDATPDPRSAAQRRHDAMYDSAMRLLRSDLPSTSGTPVTILVTMAIDDFLAGTGTAVTSRGDRIAVADILRNAADAAVVPVVLSDTGGVLSYGRTRRLASCGQRLALAARDRGCSFPGCTRPPAWCEAHHIVAWLDGGSTDMDNLTLVCGYHHRNFEALGWTCQIRDGVPDWFPPAWIDADRRPHRNTAHHVEFDFDTG